MANVLYIYLRLDKLSFRELAGDVRPSPLIQAAWEKLDSSQVLDSFRGGKFDESLLNSLKSNMQSVGDLVVDAIQKQPRDPLLKEWLLALRDIIGEGEIKEPRASSWWFGASARRRDLRKEVRGARDRSSVRMRWRSGGDGGCAVWDPEERKVGFWEEDGKRLRVGVWEIWVKVREKRVNESVAEEGIQRHRLGFLRMARERGF
ncbi:unnamed protein product [Sphenostylis stenocarpa]|uniref:Uncharacterized protein n=1 Tax=Sphenostylis stenocarpa TaxID=92480 RepID=A0AA87BAA6_9FABA|nr:unnamed protein product [Sphenostylis stenocarpa]